MVAKISSHVKMPRSLKSKAAAVYFHCRRFDVLYFPANSLFASADEAAVDAVLSHQFIVCAALNDLPLVHHKYLIRAADGLEPVGDHDDRFLLRQFRDGLHQLLFILRVDVRCGLVEDDNGSILHNSARYRKPLALAAGESRAALADYGIEALRQSHDKVIARSPQYHRQAFVSSSAPIFLQSVIDKIIYHDPSYDQESHAPVKKEHCQCQNRCGDDALSDKHRHASSQSRKVIHRIGGDRGNGAQTVFIEIAHGQIAQMIGYTTFSRFAELFKKSTGILPIEYRKIARKE